MKRFKEHWFSYIKAYRFRSIFVKNLLLILGVIMLPFISVLGISFYAYNDIQESERKAYTDSQVAQITTQVENLLDESRMKAIMLGMDDNVKLFCHLPTDGQKVSAIQDILYFLNLYSVTTDLIEGVYIYAPQNKLVISERALYGYEDFYDTACIEQMADTDGVFRFRQVEREVLGKNQRTLSLFYRCSYGKKYECIIIVNLDAKKLQGEWDYGENVSLEIVRGDEILYSDRKAEEDVAGRDCILVTKSLEDDMELKIQIDIATVNEKLRTISIYIGLFIIIMFLATVMLVFYVSKKMFNPVSEVLSAIQKEMPFEAEEEDLSRKRDEWTVIMGAIGASAVQKKNMEQNLAEKIRLLKKAQAVALQSQINPHFINNTMETINWMAIGKLGGGNDISQMLNALSSILRVSLENTDTFVTLEDEVRYARTYLFIQEKRYENRFCVVWKIPPELLGIKVIKMLLQPILENAISYGIIPYGNEGKIEIVAEKREEEVLLTVTDSGLGLTAEEVDQINGSIQRNVIRESRHIGLSNVNQRIILAFGEAYGLHISSEVGKGTKVSVILPYVFK